MTGGAERPQNAGYASTRHHGTDIFAPAGTVVRSVGDGTVEEAGWNYLGGWTVTVRDETTGVRFYYAHLERHAPGLAKGSRVTRGSIIGHVGTSGEGVEGTTNQISVPHLHSGVYIGNAATDPYPYLRRWQSP